MLLKDKRIGIWGLGVVGKSLKSFFDKQGVSYSVYDSKLTPEKSLEQFLESSDVIVPSPGVDLSKYQNYKIKFLAEADLFYEFFYKPTISITGSLGKTTITFLISKLFEQNNFNSIAGGNIGNALCNLIEVQEKLDIAVLELSSFQTEHIKKFRSKISVLANIYPNHLDRHKTLEQYKSAKLNLFAHQRCSDIALLPLSMAADTKGFKQQVYFFATSFEDFDNCKNVYYIKNRTVCFWNGASNAAVASVNEECCKLTFLENWLIVFAVLHLYGCKNFEFPKNLDLPKHRMEAFRKDGVLFYNDSKSTVAEATLKAVEKCNKPILFLGGLSKGADRSLAIASLKGNVKTVICFGNEAESLHRLCCDNGIDSKAFSTLEEAVRYCLRVVKSGDEVLFSPGGSSFDLFKNYVERGQRFKELVLGE